MPPDTLTHARKTDGGEAGAILYRHRPVKCSRISRLRSRKPARQFRTLTRPVKLALALLAEENELIESGNFWRAPSGRRIVYQTVENMFERGLVIIVYPGPKRRAHRKAKVNTQTRAKFALRLTEVGAFLARGLKTEWITDEDVAGVDRFQDATLVYGDGEA